MGLLEEGRIRSRSRTMAELAPYYHSTEGIRDELSALASRCPGMTLRTERGSAENGREATIDVVTISSSSGAPVNKNFLLFGEHSRELISPESGLHFVRSLCGETDLGPRAKEVLKENEFQIVVNGNPGSRKKVEQGDFCLRVNPAGVDLNRNWDEEWQAGAVLNAKDTNPGPRPFSEPETRAFKKLVQDFRPTTFLTIHSGTKGMYMPWAYDMEHLAGRNQQEMMEILKALDKDHCECPFGAAGREVGYSCPGTCLDWVYDRLQTPYAFAFEIYTNPILSDMLKERWQEKMHSEAASFFQLHDNLGHEHFRDIFKDFPSSFVQLNRTRSSNDHFGMEDADCFAQFNPSSKEEYESVIDNWSAAYLDMAELVAKRLSAGARGVGNSSAVIPADSFLSSVGP